MAVKVQASFAAGELDPALRERTTLQKYDSGLSTARNVIIGKTGRIISRPSRKHVWKCKENDKKAIIFIPPNMNYVLEFGHLYVRQYTTDTVTDGTGALPHSLKAELATTYTEDDLVDLNFESGVDIVYIFKKGVSMNALEVASTGLSFQTTFQMYEIPAAPTGIFTSYSGGPSGYRVDYAFTYVYTGQESISTTFTSASYLLPISAGQQIIHDVTLAPAAFLSKMTEMRIYRRPFNGGAFGYIGSSSNFTISGGNVHGHFIDIGLAADYSNSPPTITASVAANGLTGPEGFKPRTGAIYQQRLVVSNDTNEEAIEASRPGYTNNFYRDYPLSSSSALTFKSGTSGYAKVLRLIDSDGLVSFTTAGIFLHTGPLTPENLGMTRKGNWVIDPQVPPLAIPGGVFFIDGSTNSIRVLSYSTDTGYDASEVSIYSDHLFLTKKVVSWAFQEGETPLLWIVFNDGTFASLTYEKDQEMRAWTRHDSTNDVNVEYVASNGQSGRCYFVVEKDGERYVEETIPRYVSKTLIATDPQADMSESIAYMDSLVSWSSLLDTTITVVEVIADDWEGDLTLTSTDPVFTNPGPGAVGTVLRHFNTEDGTSTTLTVTARASDTSVTVSPDSEFPEDDAVGARIYETKTVFDGLDHMEGESVSVVADGYVIGSPNNDIENYQEFIVDGGEIELPAEYAIVHIGRPITGDSETLEIATAEQKPTLLEAITANKVYVKVHRSRGLYAGNEFPADDKVSGMEDVEQAPDDKPVNETEIVANRYDRPQSRRKEVTLAGSYETQGKICLRQVDPVHFEVLSIIPDIEVQPRSN